MTRFDTYKKLGNFYLSYFLFFLNPNLGQCGQRRLFSSNLPAISNCGFTDEWLLGTDTMIS